MRLFLICTEKGREMETNVQHVQDSWCMIGSQLQSGIQ